MSHVDEGLIHAYIDGAFPPGNEQGEELEAHVALCVDCRVRLEKARELKERAQVVMHRLAPETIVTPPFEEVLARRERNRAAGIGTAAAAAEQPQTGRPLNRRRTDIFPIPFAWAATVILAVGAGWMGRELVLNQRLDAADQAATIVPSEAEAPASDAASPLRMETAQTPPAVVGEAARQEREQIQERSRETVSDFAPPVASLKAADSVREQVVVGDVRVETAPIVLRGIEAVAPPSRLELRARMGAVARVVSVDSTNALVAAGPVLMAYVQASAGSRWTAEPYAAVGLIGYEPIARIEDADPVLSERAVVDSVELLRTLYVIDGDTVEIVQELEQTAVALDAVVVTAGAGNADSAAMRRDSAAAREARPRAAAPPPPERAADVRRSEANAVEAVRLATVVDTASVLESRSIVTVRLDDRVVLLLGRVPDEKLQALSARIR